MARDTPSPPHPTSIGKIHMAEPNSTTSGGAGPEVLPGARPVPALVDVEPDTLNIAPAAIAAAITARTKAVLPVHYAGHPVDLDRIGELARAHSLAVVEDAAHAIPAQYRGRCIGAGPNPVAFSFYATKNLTTAEGCMR